jgi:hypothetical protein
MDDAGQHLITTFGHCSQELINLCLTGKATSNAHDGNITLGDDSDDSIVLKGVEQAPAVGYLSAFEALNQLEVGQCYKQPKWPIWVIGGPMHYTICFSAHCGLNHVELPPKEASVTGDGIKASEVVAAKRCGVCGQSLSRSAGSLSSVHQLANEHGILYHFNGLEQTAAGTGKSMRCPEMRKCYLSAARRGHHSAKVASSDDDPELFQILLRSRWPSIDVTWDGETRSPPLLN